MEANPDTRLDIERAFTFVFKDPEWIKKVAIGGALTLTMIGIPAVMGWALEIQKRVQDGEEDTLPEWNDIGDLFIDGLKYMLVNFVWFLPFMLLYLLFMIPYMTLAIAEPTFDEPSILMMGMIFLPYLLMPIIMIASFVMYTFMPVISGSYLETRQIKDGFDFKRIFALVKANFWVLLAAAFLGYLANQVFGMIGMFICFVGMFFTTPIGAAIMYHFFGQAYNISKIKLAAKEAAAADEDKDIPAELPA